MWAVVSSFWLVTQASNQTGSDLPSAFVAYGIAAPLVGFLYFWGRSAVKQADEARAEAKATTEKLIAVVERSSPVILRATEALEKQAVLNEKILRRLEREQES